MHFFPYFKRIIFIIRIKEQKHVQLFKKTSTTFFKNMYMFLFFHTCQKYFSHVSKTKFIRMFEKNDSDVLNYSSEGTVFVFR